MSRVPKGTKTTLRSQLEQVQKATGVIPEALDNKVPNDGELQYLWAIFLKVRAGKDLLFSEIQAWSTLYGYKLEEWELEMLIKLENTLLGASDG